MCPPRRASSAPLAVLLLALAALGSSAVAAEQRTLTLEERVAAQEAIERVYYSHQIGATKPFEEAVPRELLETKVRTYLKQSVALELFWRTPVTGEMLRAELQRIASNSRSPERVQDVYAALGNDPPRVNMSETPTPFEFRVEGGEAKAHGCQG